MGFDLIGIKPTNKKGEHFRNNVWWWRRLWDFCCILVPTINISFGFCNDGEVIKGKQHRALVERIKYALDNKAEFEPLVSIRESMFIMNKQLRRMNGLDTKGEKEKEDLAFSDGFNKSDYPFDWENVAEFYSFISNNKGFQIC